MQTPSTGHFEVTAADTFRHKTPGTSAQQAATHHPGCRRRRVTAPLG